jgi:hypothetical protein
MAADETGGVGEMVKKFGHKHCDQPTTATNAGHAWVKMSGTQPVPDLRLPMCHKKNIQGNFFAKLAHNLAS